MYAAYESGGREFEFLRARHFSQLPIPKVLPLGA
jgi:hypothetical protein